MADYYYYVEETQKQNAIEAAFITARECRDVAYLLDAGDAYLLFWDNVITELEKMKG